MTSQPIPASEGPLYCFAGTVKMTDGEVVTMEGCTSSWKLCNFAFQTTLRYGKYAKVQEVTTCQLEEDDQRVNPVRVGRQQP